MYLVGGAVRDKLLGLPVKERDWVVVGAQPETLLAHGYKQVGKEFPVFLHPKTQEEYALARTERKKGHGYKGFSVSADPSVTLEQDLMRRDLTINAIAESNTGAIIDPYHGVQDIKNKILKHVSPAFIEDPLRVLRLARFAAKLPGFTVDSTTISYCRQIVQEQELLYLTKERVWQEWQKTFAMPAPWRFIEVLVSINAWQQLMPACQQPEKAIARFKKAAEKYNDQSLFLLLGLDIENDKQWQQQLQTMALPKHLADSALLIKLIHKVFNSIDSPEESLLKNLYRWDVFRRAERFEEIIKLLGYIESASEQANKWLALTDALRQIRPNQQIVDKYQGAELAAWIYQQRLALLLTSR